MVADEVKRLAGASAELSTQIQREVDECFRSLQTTQKTAESLAGHDMSTVIESRTLLVATIEHLDQINKAVDGTLQQVRATADLHETTVVDFGVRSYDTGAAAEKIKPL